MTTTTRKSRTGLIATLTIAATVVGLGIFSFIVHDRTWDWWPNPISSLTAFDGHDYNCHRELTKPARSTPGYRHLGTSLFGGEIWAPHHGFNGDIFVKFQNHMVDCSVSGGP